MWRALWFLVLLALLNSCCSPAEDERHPLIWKWTLSWCQVEGRVKLCGARRQWSWILHLCLWKPSLRCLLGKPFFLEVSASLDVSSLPLRRSHPPISVCPAPAPWPQGLLPSAPLLDCGLPWGERWHLTHAMFQPQVPGWHKWGAYFCMYKWIS